jgi:diaminohydroxyphosphoribosylaminopyrimidine deaminase / 5-amino-6-(5-phosphoribosylamino)uracil reductase
MKVTQTRHPHELFMERCLELAENGLGKVAPNPMVGAVIVHNNRVIGEGYHRQFGMSHAEVNAIQSVKEASLLADSTLYVNLEPCAHMGKTPPCSDLIILKRIAHVVIGTLDPNPLVAGKGIEKLKQNGVNVEVGILKEECTELNRRFFTFHQKQRPYIILKWAQTSDGFIDVIRKPGEPIGINWITSPISRMLVHRWRSEEQGIMVGTKTIITDNPRLTVREWKGNQPVRIILDRKLRLSKGAYVFNDEAPTIIYNELESEVLGNSEKVKLEFKEKDLAQVFNDLFNRKILSVLIEGGKELLDYLILNNYWDEARVFIGSKEFHKGLKAPDIQCNKISVEEFLSDCLCVHRNASIK